jgi:predicted porin
VLAGDDKPAAQEYGFIGDLGIKGLTVKAFKVEEGLVQGNISKTKGTNLGVKYNYDIFTVAVAQMKQKVGGTQAALDNLETKQMEYGLGLAVNKDLSVGLYMNKAEKQGSATEEKTQSVAVGYSLGPVALSAQYGKVDNMGGVADKDANVYYMSLTTAF